MLIIMLYISSLDLVILCGCHSVPFDQQPPSEPLPSSQAPGNDPSTLCIDSAFHAGVFSLYLVYFTQHNNVLQVRPSSSSCSVTKSSPTLL